MSQLAALLKAFYERSSYESVADLARSARQYGPLSDSYLKNILQGRRSNPAYDKLMAIAQALELDQEETQRLLAAAGLPTASAHDPEIQRVVAALRELTQTPGISAEAISMVVEGVLLMVEGVKTSLGTAPLKPQVIPKAASAPLRVLPAARLTPQEGAIDDLLGEILAREEAHPLDSLFQSLEEAALGDRWEVKRRVAEALPKLVQLQPEATLELASILRQDYHPDYRADIRRRVIEAVPALYIHLPQETLKLLVSREKDEVYMAMAAVEALHDLKLSGQITAEVADQYFRALHHQEPLHREVVDFLYQLLRQAESAPDQALTSMNLNRDHPERIFKICIQRTAPRLLNLRPNQVLDLMSYFVRCGEDAQPVEHQNLRRPVSKALPGILDLLTDVTPLLKDKIDQLLQMLALDPDIHVRRALGDALDTLVAVNADLGVTTLDILLEDNDPYVRQRAWRALLQLTDLYPEQAADYYARLLTRVEK